MRLPLKTSTSSQECRCFFSCLLEDDSVCRYDLEDAFGKYGPVKNVWVARRPPGFGFVEMEARLDAEEAVGKIILLTADQFLHRAQCALHIYVPR